MVCSFSRVIQPFDMQSQSGQQHEEVLNKADPKKRCDWLGPSVSRKKNMQDHIHASQSLKLELGNSGHSFIGV